MPEPSRGDPGVGRLPSTLYRGLGAGRTTLWAALFLFGGFRLGVDSLDQALVRSCWNVPSCWNAVAEVAVRRGVAPAVLDGLPAPWRQASIQSSFPPTLAVVTVSDMRHSRITYLDESYGVRAVLDRTTAEPELVTDERRGFKPLSHLWPVHDWYGDDRLETLVAFAPTLSEGLFRGVFAYVALGAEANEVLFVCRLETAPGPRFAVLGATDLNRDGHQDLVVSPAGEEAPPLATFVWNAQRRAFDPWSREGADSFVTFWCASERDRILFPRQESLDEHTLVVRARLQLAPKLARVLP